MVIEAERTGSNKQAADLSRNRRNDIRNIAIIAHVDHGKTSLVDALLKQSHVFRDNEAMGQLIMDRNPLEQEKGITILAKNTGLSYQGIKINIIDTPGHADFSGEVERVMNMADGCLLLIDAVEGPMPQTRFVLQQALKNGLKPIVVINKIDREFARIDEVVRLTQDLFLDLATSADQLDFPILYTSAKQGIAMTEPGGEVRDMGPLFECILKEVPPPVIDVGPLQMLISNIDYDNYKGRLAIGRIKRGKVSPRDYVVVINREGNITPQQVDQVFIYMGLEILEVEETQAGDIVMVTGLETFRIGDTIASQEQPQALPTIDVGEPTVEMTFNVNASPFAGREGEFWTSRQLRKRLYRELETNISLRVQDTGSADSFLVRGMGELHLAILIENMRREGYEFEVSKPVAITKMENGRLMEPVEILSIETREQYIGTITETISKRQARLTDMRNDGKGNVHLEFHIPTRGLIGFTSLFTTITRGEGIMNTLFLGYEPWSGDIHSTRNGAMVASNKGISLTYGLNNAQERGVTFIEPGTSVYEGMIVGLNSRGKDLPVNVCKEKKQTNIRASTSDIAVKLTPPVQMSLEQSLDFINSDELLEVTPKNIRLRKKLLTHEQRIRASHQAARANQE
ncbi:translational GTPase TypA [Chloroflexota bacterium]